MANYANLLAAIAANVYTNHNQEVTAAMVESALQSMVSSLGDGYQFVGIATPSTSPGTPDERVFYIAAPGTYTNFGGSVVVPEGYVAAFAYDTSWTPTLVPIGAVTAILNDMKQDTQQLGLQLFDPNRILPGCYLSGNGKTAANASYFVSGYIDITIINSGRIGVYNTGNNGVEYYDAELNPISLTTANAFNTATHPANAKYIRFTGVTANLATTRCVRYNSVISNYSLTPVYQEGVIADKMASDKFIVETIVDTINELINALNAVQYTDFFHYKIYIEEGTYTLSKALIATLNYQNTYGMYLQDEVDLIGLGRGATIQLNLTGESATDQQYISTINANKNNLLENLTFIINNGRYALHADGGALNTDKRMVVRSCTFIHLGNSDGNWLYPAAVGEGSGSGNRVLYENCIMASPLRAYLLHNYSNQAKPSEHIYKNCQFLGTGDGSCSVMLQPMGSNVRDIVKFYGCTFNGMFDHRVNNAAPPGVELDDYEITARACSPIAYNGYFTSSTRHIDFGEFIQRFINTTGSAITANTPLKRDQDGSISVFASGDDVNTFAGVAMEAVAAGDTGPMQTQGYVRFIGSANVGDPVTIKNGAFAIASSGDVVIGYVKWNTDIYNRRYFLIP